MNLCFPLAYLNFFATSYALAPKAAGQPLVCWSWLALAPERESHAFLRSSAFGSFKPTIAGVFTAWRLLKSAVINQKTCVHAHICTCTCLVIKHLPALHWLRHQNSSPVLSNMIVTSHLWLFTFKLNKIQNSTPRSP